MVGQQRFELGYPIEDEGTTRAVMGDRAAGRGGGRMVIQTLTIARGFYKFMIL